MLAQAPDRLLRMRLELRLCCGTRLNTLRVVLMSIHEPERDPARKASRGSKRLDSSHPAHFASGEIQQRVYAKVFLQR
jgi:hypothetical protein